MVIRTWNLFHGNADPPQRRGFLREMVELITVDQPAVVCLQEVPIWAVRKLDEWGGMACLAAVTRRPRLPGALGRGVTSLHLGLFRSALTGQANAILVDRRHRIMALGSERISDAGREPRIVHAVRVEGLGVVANLHASNDFARPEVPWAEVERARRFVERHGAPGEPVVLAGDLNLTAPQLDGFSPPGPGIDHIFVRGRSSSPVHPWPKERTTLTGVVLSDHPPVEVVLG
ncbi:MAG: endonuclease/exonuclease/phosphatase family protein [Gaiellales bacterium]